MMNNRLAVFVLSHRRPHGVRTIEALRNSGYTGDAFVVVDNEDPSLADYYTEFKDSLLVFDKSEQAGRADTMSTLKKEETPLFARNWIQEKAAAMGYGFAIEADDDIEKFTVRYLNDEKLVSKKACNLDGLFEDMTALVSEGPIVSVGIISEGALFGGKNGVWKDGLQWNINQFFMVKTDKHVVFRGIYNEDMNALCECARVGKACLEMTRIVKASPKRGSNAGGLHDSYASSGEYVRDFYSVIAAPSCCKIAVDGGGTSLSCKKTNAFPKILSDAERK